jgi:hypothetical protein
LRTGRTSFRSTWQDVVARLSRSCGSSSFHVRRVALAARSSSLVTPSEGGRDGERGGARAAGGGGSGAGRPADGQGSGRSWSKRPLGSQVGRPLRPERGGLGCRPLPRPGHRGQPDPSRAGAGGPGGTPAPDGRPLGPGRRGRHRLGAHQARPGAAGGVDDRPHPSQGGRRQAPCPRSLRAQGDAVPGWTSGTAARRPPGDRPGRSALPGRGDRLPRAERGRCRPATLRHRDPCEQGGAGGGRGAGASVAPARGAQGGPVRQRPDPAGSRPGPGFAGPAVSGPWGPGALHPLRRAVAQRCRRALQ